MTHDPLAPSPAGPPLVSSRRAWIALAVLFLINLTNYADRFLIVALAGPIRKEFGVDNAAVGLLSSSFVIVYMLASPLAGFLSDRVPRRIVIAAAIALWCLATATASRAPSFTVLLITRALVGIGEAGYNAAGSALLTDVFPVEKRGRALAIFNLAIPVGSALGYGLAGVLQAKLGWRDTCLYVGGSGLALAPLAFFLLQMPQREKTAEAEETGGLAATARTYGELLRDPIYTTNLLGMAMMTFALGGLAQWAVPWLEAAHKLTHEEADWRTGVIVASSGFVGTALGAVVADAFSQRGLIRAYALVTAAGYAVAVPALAIALGPGSRFPTLGIPRPESETVALGLIFVSMVGAFLGTGPSNAIVSLRAPAAHRASAFALLTFAIHFLGDAASPPAMGFVADRVKAGGGTDDAAYTAALGLAPVALGIAALSMIGCFWAARRDPPPAAA